MALARYCVPMGARQSRLLSRIAKWTISTSTQKATLSSSRADEQTITEEGGLEKTRRLEPSEADTLFDIGIRNVFNEDHDMLRSSIRRFVHNEIKPRHREWEIRGYPDPDVYKQVCDAGLACLNCPSEMHGQGGDVLDSSILIEEFCYANIGFYNSLTIMYDLILPYLVHYGSAEQLEKYVKGMAKEGLVGSLGMTEPDAGSDLKGIKTFAKQDGDDWIINGSKTFITNGSTCQFCLVVAKTSRESISSSNGIGMFLVDADSPGFHKGKPFRKLGLSSSDTAPIYFEDVRVPKTAALGDPNKGFYYMMSMLPYERLAAAEGMGSLAEFAFEQTRNYVKERKAFGKTLSALQTVQHKLAEMKTELCVARAFFDQCLQKAAEKRLDPNSASMTKYWTSDAALRVANQAMQMHGGAGYMEESEVCRAFGWIRVGTIYAGSNEIMKELICRPIIK